MKALTLIEPWGTLCVLGAKKFETRSWSTSYRGPLAIHISKKRVDPIYTQEPFKSALRGIRYFNYGCIIGTVDLVNCQPTDDVYANVLLPQDEQAFGNWSPGRYAWQLANPQRLVKPISINGGQRLWNAPDDALTALKVVAPTMAQNKLATQFVMKGIQEWGQTEEERRAAVQGIVAAAGFVAIAQGFPVFGGIWTKGCHGRDADEAMAWLKMVTDTMPRGHFEDEVDHVAQAIQRRVSTP